MGFCALFTCTESFRQFLGVIVQHFENSFPKQIFKLTYKTRIPWMTPDLRHKICEKNTVYKATLSDPQNKELIRVQEKLTLTSQLKNTEILYYPNELDINNKHDASKSWKILKKYHWKTRWELFAEFFFSFDNVIIDNSQKIANEFNNFFVSIDHNLAKDITCNVNPLFYVNSANDSILVQHVSVAQVRNIITSLKDSSPGWDHFSPFVMKQCVDTYVEPITVLINNSFYH